ncbi:MAG: hypothetical protein [Circular genetic element sp.]|nr:MAG: hypothetical protein [Circular genetic element sp.]
MRTFSLRVHSWSKIFLIYSTNGCINEQNVICNFSGLGCWLVLKDINSGRTERSIRAGREANEVLPGAQTWITSLEAVFKMHAWLCWRETASPAEGQWRAPEAEYRLWMTS